MHASGKMINEQAPMTKENKNSPYLLVIGAWSLVIRF